MTELLCWLVFALLGLAYISVGLRFYSKTPRYLWETIWDRVTILVLCVLVWPMVLALLVALESLYPPKYMVALRDIDNVDPQSEAIRQELFEKLVRALPNIYGF